MRPKVSIAQEARKGMTSDLRVKKIGTDVTRGTGYTGMEASTYDEAGTRIDQFRSIDRNSMNQDYGSIRSPDSPNRGGRTSYIAKNALSAVKPTFDNRRHTTTAN